MNVTAEFLRRIAAAAAAETLPRFRSQGAVANKEAGGFDPVTEADREAERAIRALIRAEFPDHGILGEEYGIENAGSSHVWVIDPIDGTRAFISGLPVWGTLVGLTVDGDAVAGMMAQPFTGELFYATDSAAHYEGRAGRASLTTRQTTALADATLFTTTPALFKGAKRDAYDRLESAVRLARYGTDCYAFAMVAAGHVDIVADRLATLRHRGADPDHREGRRRGHRLGRRSRPRRAATSSPRRRRSCIAAAMAILNG